MWNKKKENKQIQWQFCKKFKIYVFKCTHPNGFLTLSPHIRFVKSPILSLSTNPRAEVSLSLNFFPSLSLSPKPPTHSSPLSQSPPFLLGHSIILFTSPSLHPTTLISLLSFFFSSVQVTYHRFLAFVIRFEKLNFSGFVVFD